jgi:hypothetical protein
MGNWVLELNSLYPHIFTDLTYGQGVTGTEAGRYAREALLAYGYTPAGRDHTTWQSAWNTLTGATPDRTGYIIIHNPTCGTCNGKGYTMNGAHMIRAMSMGLPQSMCPACRGTRHGNTLQLTALHTPEPTAEPAP